MNKFDYCMIVIPNAGTRKIISNYVEFVASQQGQSAVNRGTNHKRGNEAAGSVQNKVDVAHKKTVLDFVNYDPQKKPQAVTAKFGDSPVFFKYIKRRRKTLQKKSKNHDASYPGSCS